MINPIKALIIESDTKNISSLVKLLHKVNPTIIISATSTTVALGEQLIYQHQPDVVFISIEMLDENPLKMLDSIRDKGFEIVYLTNGNNCSRDCCKHHPLDCLPIPIEEHKLRTTLSSLYCTIEQHSRAKLIENPLYLNTNITIHSILLRFIFIELNI